MADVKLTYFDFSGSRGEECRLALHIAGVAFDDERVKGADWPERKSSTPFGSMPVLTVSGQGELSQSNAILVYVGRGHGLHPTDPWQAAKHDEILSAGEELRGKVAAVLFQKLDDDAKREARQKLTDEVIRPWGHAVEGILGDGPFVGGADISVADIKLYMLVRWFAGGGVDHIPADVFSGCPKLTALYEAVGSHPAVAEWNANH